MPHKPLIQTSDYMHLLAGIPSGSADLVFTDPPYGVNYQNPYTKDKFPVISGDSEFFSYSALAREAYRILRPGTCFLAFTGWSTYPRHFDEIAAEGFTMKEPIIGQKRPSGTTDLEGSFQTNSDWVIFAHKGRFKFHSTELLRNKRAGTVPNKGRKPVPEWKRRFPSAWFGPNFPYSSENPQFQKKLKAIGAKARHPTIKGREFCEWLIQLTTHKGGMVVDPFAGSGTIPLAAAALGRSVVAGDKIAAFAELTKLRIANNV